jgi:hypothetical protein
MMSQLIPESSHILTKTQKRNIAKRRAANCLKFAKLPFQVLAVCATVSQVITRSLPTIVGQKFPDEWEHLWHISASKLLALCQNAGNFTAIKMLL